MLEIWTPLRPSKSGIANFTDHMFLNNNFDIEIDFIVNQKNQLINPRTKLSSHCDRGKPKLLQIGNNFDHDYIYYEALRRRKVKKIVEFHDLNLHHLITSLTLKHGDAAGYISALERNHFKLGRRFAIQRLKGIYHERMQFLLRCTRQVSENADAIIVHSNWAKNKLNEDGIDKPIYVIPHYSIQPKDSFVNPKINRKLARN